MKGQLIRREIMDRTEGGLACVHEWRHTLTYLQFEEYLWGVGATPTQPTALYENNSYLKR